MKERERKAFGWFGNQVASVTCSFILGSALSSVVSVFVTFFVFLKAGLLRLSQWPGAAFIVLAILVSVFGAVVFGLAVVYMMSFVSHSIGYAFARLFGGELPKRHRLLEPIDLLAGAVVLGIDKVTSWKRRRKKEGSRPTKGQLP